MSPTREASSRCNAENTDAFIADVAARLRTRVQVSTDGLGTSYAERNNLRIRMGTRRYTRLTNAHSKKLENHVAATALHFAHYNLVRRHSTLRVSPAMAAGVSKTLWSVDDLVGAALERA